MCVCVCVWSRKKNISIFAKRILFLLINARYLPLDVTNKNAGELRSCDQPIQCLPLSLWSPSYYKTIELAMKFNLVVARVIISRSVWSLSAIYKTRTRAEIKTKECFAANLCYESCRKSRTLPRVPMLLDAFSK